MSFAEELTAIGRNPNVAILSQLHDSALRLSELLEHDPGRDESILSDRLRELDRAGLVARRVDSGTSATRPLRAHAGGPALGADATFARRLGRRVRSADAVS